jgi:hypothetical protein
MSVSGIRVAESNPHEARLRASGSQQVNAEELLAELVRLVESSTLAPGQSQSPAQPAPKANRMDTGPKHALEMMSLRPSADAPPSRPSETGAVNVEPPRAAESDDSYSSGPYGIDLAKRRRSGAWPFKVSALVLAGAAGIGSMFWFKLDEPRLPKAPAFIATTRDPTVQPRRDSTVATSSGAMAASAGDIPQPVPVKTVSSEERPADLSARASLSDPPPPGLGPTATGAGQPAADASAGSPLAAPVNSLAAAGQNAASPPVASQTLDSEPAPTVLPATDPAQIATPTPTATDSGRTTHATDAPLPPVRPAQKAASQATGVPHRSTPMPTKLSGESAARKVVAKADAKAPRAPVERGASVKPGKGATTLEAAQAPAEAQAPPPEPPLPAQQSNPNPVVHAFSSMVGALNGLNPFAIH